MVKTQKINIRAIAGLSRVRRSNKCCGGKTVEYCAYIYSQKGSLRSLFYIALIHTREAILLDNV